MRPGEQPRPTASGKGRRCSPAAAASDRHRRLVQRRCARRGWSPQSHGPAGAKPTFARDDRRPGTNCCPGRATPVTDPSTGTVAGPHVLPENTTASGRSDEAQPSDGFGRSTSPCPTPDQREGLSRTRAVRVTDMNKAFTDQPIVLIDATTGRASPSGEDSNDGPQGVDRSSGRQNLKEATGTSSGC